MLKCIEAECIIRSMSYYDNMIINREVSTIIMMIIFVTFDWDNQYRMRRHSQRLFEQIEFLGSVPVLYIQITVRVIVKCNSNEKPIRLLRAECP